MVLQPQRDSNMWVHPYLGPRRPTKLAAATPIEEEVYSAIEYVSEIPNVGIPFISALGVSNASSTYDLFRALVRQSKTFFQTGMKLHFRAAALMYYYSFLNLAKAYLAIRNPAGLSKNPTHGLSIGRFTPRSLREQKIYASGRGSVFQGLYQAEFGRRLPKGFPLDITTLLGYSSDVMHEYQRASFGRFRLLPSKIRLLSHQAGRISWPFIAVLNFDQLRPFKKSLTQFFAYFEEVQPDRQFIRHAMEIMGENHQQFAYFQSRRTYSWSQTDTIDIAAIRADAYRAINPLFESPIHSDEYDFKITLPLRTNYQLPMNQPLAVYACLFFIGSLVRYHPEYLERLLDSEEAWIVERFVRGSSLSLLRYFANAILGEDYLFFSR